MIVHRSNRVEVLVEKLFQLRREAPVAPFDRELMVFPGAAMEAYVGRVVAARCGLWAGVEALLVRGLIDEILDALSPPEEGAKRSDPERGRWWIFEHLGQLEATGEYEALAKVLASPRSRWAMAQKLARAFDQYSLYRPQMLQTWRDPSSGPKPKPNLKRAGPVTAWQPRLWRAYERDFAPQSLDRRLHLALEQLSGENPRTGEALRVLGPRIVLFGVGALPPMFVQVLDRLSKWIPVHLFRFSALFTELSDGRAEVRASAEASQPERFYGYDQANEHGNSFAQLLEARQRHDSASSADFIDPIAVAAHLGRSPFDLERVQHWGGAPGEAPRGFWPELVGDDSFELHRCAGTIREVEALHQRIRRMLSEDSSLKLGDIVVLVSDIQRYAPHIDAVFGSLNDGPGRSLAYRILDRNDASELPLVSWLLQFLRSLEGRAPRSELLDLFCGSVGASVWELSPNECEGITELVERAAIRWGQDGAEREALGQPPVADHSWKAGLSRLLLGCAYHEEGWGDATAALASAPGAPLAPASSEERALLGQLAAWLEFYFEFRAQARSAASMAQWEERLQGVLELIADTPRPELRGELGTIRQTLRALVQSQADSGVEPLVELNLFILMLEQGLKKRSRHGRYATAAITVGEVMPMRCIPRPVVALLGFDARSFPRSEAVDTWNQIQAHPQPGDKSRVREDRFALVEALYSARRAFWVFYSDRDASEGKSLAPNTFVAGLLECWPPELRATGSDRGRPGPVYDHPRHGDQLHGDQLHGDQDGAGGSEEAGAVGDTFASAPRFRLHRALAFAKPERISVDAFVQYFRYPSQSFARQLGIDVSRSRWSPDDREPGHLSGIEGSRAGARLLAGGIAAAPRGELFSQLRRSGELAWGKAGEIAFEDMEAKVQRLLERAEALGVISALGRLPEFKEIALEIGETRIEGKVGVYPSQPPRRISLRYPRLSGQELLENWIYHLLLSAQGGFELGPTLVIGRSGSKDKNKREVIDEIHWPLISKAGAYRYITQLVEIYCLGHRWPLPIFSRSTSREYVKQARSKKGGHQSGLNAARQAWQGNKHAIGEQQLDPAAAWIFGDEDPLSGRRASAQLDALELEDGEPEGNSDFCRLALAVFGPMHENEGGES